MTDTTRQARRTDPATIGAASWAWPTPWIERPDRAQDTGGQGLEAAPLFALHHRDGQSPWLDHLTRKDIVGGALSRMVAGGIRGVTVNRDVQASALEVSPEYAEQLSWLLLTGCTVEEAYWELAATDVQAACTILQPIYEASQAEDGFVSVEVAPSRAHCTPRATAAARQLHDRIDRPNLLVGIPATPEGVPALEATVSHGRNTNATSISSIGRYAAAVDAYMAGLEAFVAHGGDPATVHGVASFCLNSAAVAQARRAYQLFEERFSSERWERLARRGANPQRLLWTSSATDAAGDRGSGYVEDLIAPHTIHAVSISTAMSMARDGTGERPHDSDGSEAAAVLSAHDALGVHLGQVDPVLEHQSGALPRRPVASRRRPTARWRAR